jgi:hypothetical protein
MSGIRETEPPWWVRLKLGVEPHLAANLAPVGAESGVLAIQPPILERRVEVGVALEL